MGIGLTPGFKYYKFFPYILKQIYELHLHTIMRQNH